MTIVERVTRHPSAIALVLANLVPLWGVIVHDWDPYALLLVYWYESAILGLLNIPRMLISGGLFTELIGKLFMSAFFCVHYGMFMFGHLFFLSMFAGIETAMDPPGLFVHSLDLLGASTELQLPVLALAISHLFSFVVNDIGKREYLNSRSHIVMGSVYGRIIIMHLTVLFGGWLMFVTSAGTVFVALLILIKTPIDLKMHLRQHEKNERLSAEDQFSVLAG